MTTTVNDGSVTVDCEGHLIRVVHLGFGASGGPAVYADRERLSAGQIEALRYMAAAGLVGGSELREARGLSRVGLADLASGSPTRYRITQAGRDVLRALDSLRD